MGKLGDYLASQCGNPRGVIGKIMTWAMNRANNVMYKGIIEEINISPKTKILDVGFGNGYLEKLIIRKSPCSITGIDISEDMVRKATEVLLDLSLSEHYTACTGWSSHNRQR